MLSSTPSTQIITDNNELKNDVTNVELDIEQRRVCSIPFEEYMSLWMKTATTNPEVLMRRESLDDLNRYTERFAVLYGSIGGEAHYHIQAQRIRNTCVQKLQNKDIKRKPTHKRKNIRRFYMQGKAPEGTTPQITGSAQDSDGQEHWEQEMDELVAWTHSLSFKELDDL